MLAGVCTYNERPVVGHSAGGIVIALARLMLARVTLTGNRWDLAQNHALRASQSPLDKSRPDWAK